MRTVEENWNESIDEKPPNPMRIEEENRKIVGALNFLAPEGMLKKS